MCASCAFSKIDVAVYSRWVSNLAAGIGVCHSRHCQSVCGISMLLATLAFNA